MNCIFTCNELHIVVDNNILIDLFELGRLDILFLVSSKVIIPRYIYNEEVQSEIKDLLNDFKYTLEDITMEEGLDLYNKLTNDSLFKRLSKSDKLAISIAHENLYFCTSNDGLIRKACTTYNVKLTGILGLLGRAYKLRIIDKSTTVNLARSLENTSCYIKTSIIEEFILDYLQ